MKPLTGARAHLALHPENGHYFLFKNRPTILVTSGEHYGAVLNADFHFIRYLNELKARGFNLTRTFSGTYREVPGSFNITDNPLAPAPERFVCPWQRDGSGKFDLTKWNGAYFRRLKDFVREAGRRGVIVELVLFCAIYDDALWNVNPMNAKNNVNGVGDHGRGETYSLKNTGLLAVQEAFARRISEEMGGFENLYYEVFNEPYATGVPMDWQDHMASVLGRAEAALPVPHLIAQNVNNGGAVIKSPHPAVSIFNFHYANPPVTVRDNYGLNKPIAFDETGFVGTGDTRYRTDAWEFLLAGGSVYSHLDYSYTAGHPDGTFAFPPSTPGGGGSTLRGQLATLKRFIEGFDFVRMRPENGIVKTAPGATVWALAEPGRQYAVYIKGRTSPASGKASALTLDVPRGRYRAEWLHPQTGETADARDVDHGGGDLELAAPAYAEDIALRLTATRNRARRSG